MVMHAVTPVWGRGKQRHPAVFSGCNLCRSHHSMPPAHPSVHLGHCRRAGNILLHLATAMVVHIDLGVAFDQGALLTTPERVPFRCGPGTGVPAHQAQA